MNNEIEEILEKYAESYEPIPSDRNYWLIRTNGGSYYDSFKEYNFVAIGHNNINIGDVNRVGIMYKNDLPNAKYTLKKLAHEKYPKEERPGLIGNQIARFAFELKKGDVVIIPSYNSDFISFGTIESDSLLNTNKADIVRTDCSYTKRKKVKWNKEIRKDDLDIYLYRALHAHQAINNISHQADIIERTLGNFYFIDSEGNLVLNVQTREEIKAIDLFTLGYSILEYSNDFFKSNGIESQLNDIDIKINLNSPGKIQLKSKHKGVLVGMALLIVGVVGGGLEVELGGIQLKTDGLIKNIIDYQDSAHNREMKEKIITKMDSLDVIPPTDVLNLLGKFSSEPDSLN